VSTAFDGNLARTSGDEESWQDGLQHQRSAARGTDGEVVLTWLDPAGFERQRL
jgi:hypothetical protein